MPQVKPSRSSGGLPLWALVVSGLALVLVVVFAVQANEEPGREPANPYVAASASPGYSPGSTPAVEDRTEPEAVDDSGCYSVACKLATIDTQSPVTEDDAIVDQFQAAIDCIMASGIEGAETEQKVGDVLVASWQASAQTDTLLEWSQALCFG